MKKSNRIAMLVLIILLFLASGCSSNDIEGLQAKIDQYKNRIQALEEENKQLIQSLQSNTVKKDSSL